MVFTSYDKNIMDNFKGLLARTFYFLLFETLKVFLGWEVEQRDESIFIIQTRYVRQKLKFYGMLACNGTYTLMVYNPDTTPV